MNSFKKARKGKCLIELVVGLLAVLVHAGAWATSLEELDPKKHMARYQSYLEWVKESEKSNSELEKKGIEQFKAERERIEKERERSRLELVRMRKPPVNTDEMEQKKMQEMEREQKEYDKRRQQFVLERNRRQEAVRKLPQVPEAFEAGL